MSTETAAVTLSDWPHVYREGSSDRPVLLMLHGTGATEHDLLGLAAALDPAAAVLSPRGRVSENGMNRWFRRLSEGVFDLDDVERRADELAEFVAQAREQYDLGEREVVAVGFSNGANIGLATALRHPLTLPRAVAFSGMHPLPGRDLAASLGSTAVLLLNGDSDPMAPSASVDTLEAMLTERGARVQRERRAGGHGIAEAEVAAATAWLA